MKTKFFTKTRWLVTIILLATFSIGQMRGAVSYVKIDSLADVTTGDYVIVGCQTSTNFGLLTYGTLSSGRIPYSKTYSSSSLPDTIKDPAGGSVWTLAVTTSNNKTYVTLYNATNSKYIASNTGTHNGKYKYDANSGMSFEITYNSGTYGKYAIASGTYYLGVNKSANYWRGYTSSNLTATNGLTLYKRTYTVTYNNNGGSGDMKDTSSPYKSGATVTVKTNTFTRGTNYSFDKWNTKANGTGVDFLEGAKFTISKDTTFYAQWKSAGGSTPTLTLTGSGAFGTVNVDGTKDLNFTLNGSNLSANASVSVTGSGFTLVTPAGGTLTQTAGNISGSNNITVRFSPTAAISYAGTLTVKSTGASDATVSLSGTGQLSDTYVDLMHDNSDITKTGSYSAPSMSTDDTGSDCKGTHKYFAGWSTSAGSTTVSVKAGDAVTADGSTYYAVWGDGEPTITYTRLTSIAGIDESAQYVLGIDGTGFHYSGTSSWGLMALPANQTPLYYTLTKEDAATPTYFTAATSVSSTPYYLQVAGTGAFNMTTSSGTTEGQLVIGSTTNYGGADKAYAVSVKGTTTKSLRRNGNSGIRCYDNTSTGSLVFFYKVVTSGDIDYVTSCCELKPATSVAVESTTGTSATLSWTAPSPTMGISKLQVRDASDDAVLVDNLLVSATGATVTGLTECNEYTFYVASVGATCYTASESVDAQPYSGAKTVTYKYHDDVTPDGSFTTDCSHTSTNLPNPSRTGYTLNGWYTDASGGTKKGDGGASYTPDADITLHAQWSETNYAVTMQQSPSVGATLTGATNTAHYGGTINISATVPDGYQFVNWTSSPSVTFASATSASTSFTMPASNVTVTANFQQTHTVTWNVNGAAASAASLGLASNPVVYDHGGSLVLPSTNPSAPAGCSSKVFIGWTSDPEITVAQGTRPTIISAGGAVNADITYRAVFADKDDTGGSGSTDITISSSWTKRGTSGGGNAGTTGVILVTQDGVTLTHPKGYISTDVRMYKEYDCTISVGSPSKITKIEITTADNSYNATKWDSFDDNYSTVYDSGTSKWNGVWKNTSGQTSVVFSVTDQVRFSKIKVFYTSVSYDNYITLCSSCTTPSTLEVSSITSTGGTVSWDGVSLSPTEGFKVAWNTSNSVPSPLTASNSHDVAAGTNEYAITGLTAATQYYVFVQSKCNSTWSSSTNFYTNAKITYTAGTGASGSMTPKEVTYNTNATVDACTFDAPSGKTFNGWVSDQAVTVGGSSTTSVPDGAMISNLTAAITLTAQWRDLAQYHVTFSADNGTVAGGPSQTVTEGGTLTFPNVTSTTCGTFQGWVEAAYDNTAKPSGATFHAVGDELAADPAMDGKTYYAVYRVATGAPTNITDELTAAKIGVTSYEGWSGVADASAAVYAGNSTKNTTYSNSIQIRTQNSNSGIVTTTSGGLAKKVTFEWVSGNTSGRIVDIYGKNSAYSSAADLYDSEKQGTKIGSITYNSTTELTISTDYEYIGIRSNSGAAYIGTISIQWYGAPMKYQTSPACSPVVSITSSFSSFTYVYSNGPSASQSFTVNGTNLSTNPLVVTAPANYEVCKTSDGTYTTSVSYTPTDGTVTDQTVYIRLVAGLNVGTYNYDAASGVSVASEGATTRSAALNGSVTKATGAIAFTDFNAVDHYEAEWTGSAILVPYNYSKTGDGTLTTEKVGGRGGAVDTENKKWSLTNEGTYTLRLTLGNGTNYTGAGPVTADFVIYKADRYYDNLHGNEMILKRNDSGEDHYTIPSLSDETRQTSGSCSQTHYHFMGWVPESALSSLPDDAAYTAVMITGGGTQAASGTNYYAVWAEE